jgi:hypothetical protein
LGWTYAILAYANRNVCIEPAAFFFGSESDNCNARKMLGDWFAGTGIALDALVLFACRKRKLVKGRFKSRNAITETDVH